MLHRKLSPGPLYVDLTSSAAQFLAAHPDDKTWLQRVVDTPQAIWLGHPGAITGFRARLNEADAEGTIVTAVLYYIPKRDDQGKESAGGAPDATAYAQYVDDVCGAIGDRRVIVVVEPDALADMLSEGFAHLRDLRTALLRQSCARLSALKNTDVYIDVGHSSWPNFDALKDWLDSSGILENVTGLSMNVSNFMSTKDCLDRARTLLQLQDHDVLPVIVDCSRNGVPLPPGLGGKDSWCNPIAARLGPDPLLEVTHFHGHLWIKRPGESDGEHNGGPSPGQFDRALCYRLCRG